MASKAYRDTIRKRHRAEKSREERKRLYQAREWYTIRSIMGNSWAFFYILLGARERGKSYSVQEYALNQRIKNDVPFY